MPHDADMFAPSRPEQLIQGDQRKEFDTTATHSVPSLRHADVCGQPLRTPRNMPMRRMVRMLCVLSSGWMVTSCTALQLVYEIGKDAKAVEVAMAAPKDAVHQATETILEANGYAVEEVRLGIGVSDPTDRFRFYHLMLIPENEHRTTVFASYYTRNPSIFALQNHDKHEQLVVPRTFRLLLERIKQEAERSGEADRVLLSPLP